MTDFGSTITLEQLDADPYPVYARLRRDEPVAWVPAVNLWMVTRWADVRRVISSPESFVTAFPSAAAQICGQQAVLTVEGDWHAELRASLDDQFSREVVPEVARMTREVAVRHTGSLIGRGEAELMTEYFKPVAAAALGRFAGLGDVDPATLIRWSGQMLDGFNNPLNDPGQHQRALAAAAEVAAIARPIAERAATQPDGSLLSHLMRTGCPSGSHRSPDEVLPTYVNIVSTFIEPAWAGGTTLLALLRHPEQLNTVLSNPVRLRDAIRESLRYWSTIGTLGRRTTRPVTLDGRTLPEGAIVGAAIASANRDEAIYPDADRFDIDRQPQPNAGLGYGRHQCLAAAIVSPIITMSLEVLFEHIGEPRLDTGEPSNLRGWKFRKPDNLHVKWTNSPVTRKLLPVP
jgi:cytochrome P450